MKPRQEFPSTVDTESVLPLIQGLAHLHEAVALFDSDGSLSWASDGLGQVLGGVEGVLRKPWGSLVADADELADRLFSEGRISNQATELRGVNGDAIPVTMSAARLGPAGGRSPTVAILRLAPGADRVHREFRHTLEYLSAVLDGSPEGVLVVDRSRFITYANPAAAALTGNAREELIDKPLALFMRGGDDVERIAAALRPEDPVRNQELELRRSDGAAVQVSVSASLLRLPDGTPVGAVAYLRDVTQERRYEESLARKNGELEHYVEAVSHDLRSPLVSLRGFSRLLREDYGARLDDKGLHFLERIDQAGRTMENLIHDLLELSRIGRQGLGTALVDLRSVLLQLRAELKPRLDALGVDLRLPTTPPLLRCDRTRLYQVFSNLVGNALDHMGVGEEPVVEIAVAEQGEEHRITVRDNGRGIPPEHHERIFEIFQSLGPRPDGRRGTGIGLAIVKKIAETQGGRVWVESAPGRGAAFHLTLPKSQS